MTSTPKKEFFWKALTVVSCAIVVVLTFVLLAQSRDLIKEINRQTDINQRYLRCILLIERDKFENVESRVAAIDDCAIKSKTPENIKLTEPTSQKADEFSTLEKERRTVATTPTTQPDSQPQTRQEQPSSNQTPTPVQPTQPPKPVEEPQPSVFERVITAPLQVVDGLTQLLFGE